VFISALVNKKRWLKFLNRPTELLIEKKPISFEPVFRALFTDVDAAIFSFTSFKNKS
jgi:hypothetical protein